MKTVDKQSNRVFSVDQIRGAATFYNFAQNVSTLVQTARVVLSGLESAVTYTVECNAQDLLGNNGAFVDMDVSKKMVNTKCCRTVNFINPPRFFYGDNSVFDGTDSKSIESETKGANSAVTSFVYTLSSAPDLQIVSK
jgi:hypothetical protein